MDRGHCLVIEDDSDVAGVVEYVLKHDGFEVTRTRTGDEAIDLCKEIEPDVVILDLDLPGKSGQQTARELREFSDSYIVILSGHGSAEDRVEALRSSVDDYISKPFERGELVARLHAMLRRPRAIKTAKNAERLVVNKSARLIQLDSARLNLTSLEYELLALLAESMPDAVPKPKLIERGWRNETGTSPHILNVHIHNIRRKLAAVTPDFVVESARGVGFRLIDKTA